VSLLVLKDVVTNCDDYTDDLLSFLKDNSESYKPSQSKQTVIIKEELFNDAVNSSVYYST
jgi:hypothetical protein